jgi:hypothetical protein
MFVDESGQGNCRARIYRPVVCLLGYILQGIALVTGALALHPSESHGVD